MNPYYNPLLLDIPPLRDGFNIEQISEHHVPISLTEINPEIKELLMSLGITVSWIELFYRKPGHIGSIHADNRSGDFTKINWIYKGKKSKMLWFTVKDSSSIKEPHVTMANTEYLKYSITEVTRVETAMLTGPSLVQVGIPHLVINPHEDRYCLCFVLSDLNGERLTMEHAQQLLSEYIQTDNNSYLATDRGIEPL
jgi:hypothetical protein